MAQARRRKKGFFGAGARAMAPRLKRWYRGNLRFDRVSTLTPGMILGTGGTIYRPCLRAKGAESRGLAFFARDELRRHVDTIGTPQARVLLLACCNLCSFYDIMNRSGRVLPENDLRALVGCVVNHNAQFVASGGAVAPKHHMWMHLARQFRRNCNMKFLSTYPDETLNGAFFVCKSVSFIACQRSSVDGSQEVLCLDPHTGEI